MRQKLPQFTGSDHGVRSSRSGAVSVVLLIAILVIFSLGMTMIQTSLKQRERTLDFEERQQSTWLAEAGIERAARQLQSDPDYRGETWHLTGEQLQRSQAGLIEIQVASHGDNANRRIVTVIADYPQNISHRIRTKRTVRIDLQSSTDNSRE